MPRLVAAASAAPPHVTSQSEVRKAIARVFDGRLPDLEHALAVFDHARIERRHFMRPLDWYGRPRSAAERNGVYLGDGLDLVARAATSCLARAGCPPEAVDHIIAVSSSGHATPSLDARLIGRLGLRPDATRLPVWGLGCAGGAAGISRALDHCRAYPESRVLLTALETCSLTFAAGDVSKKNLVASAIFADGAAAVLVAGDAVDAAGPQLLASHSHLFADSSRIMGWDFVDEGMELVLSPRLPALIKTELGGLIERFLHGRGLAQDDIVHYLAHPGGARVIDAYRDALGLENGEIDLTGEVLREFGNVSSVSVLIVLERWLASERSRRPGYGLISAFGPGFSAEQVLLEV